MELAQIVQTKLLLVKRLYYAGHVGGFFLSKLSFLKWTFYVASTRSMLRQDNLILMERFTSSMVEHVALGVQEVV